MTFFSYLLYLFYLKYVVFIKMGTTEFIFLFYYRSVIISLSKLCGDPSSVPLWQLLCCTPSILLAMNILFCSLLNITIHGSSLSLCHLLVLAS